MTKELSNLTLREILLLQNDNEHLQDTDWFSFLYHFNHLIRNISATNDGVDTTSVRALYLEVASKIKYEKR